MIDPSLLQLIKAGLALALFGGSQRYVDSKVPLLMF